MNLDTYLGLKFWLDTISGAVGIAFLIGCLIYAWWTGRKHKR